MVLTCILLHLVASIVVQQNVGAHGTISVGAAHEKDATERKSSLLSIDLPEETFDQISGASTLQVGVSGVDSAEHGEEQHMILVTHDGPTSTTWAASLAQTATEGVTEESVPTKDDKSSMLQKEYSGNVRSHSLLSREDSGSREMQPPQDDRLMHYHELKDLVRSARSVCIETPEEKWRPKKENKEAEVSGNFVVRFFKKTWKKVKKGASKVRNLAWRMKRSYECSSDENCAHCVKKRHCGECKRGMGIVYGGYQGCAPCVKNCDRCNVGYRGKEGEQVRSRGKCEECRPGFVLNTDPDADETCTQDNTHRTILRKLFFLEDYTHNSFIGNLYRLDAAKALPHGVECDFVFKKSDRPLLMGNTWRRTSDIAHGEDRPNDDGKPVAGSLNGEGPRVERLAEPATTTPPEPENGAYVMAFSALLLGLL